MKKARSPFENAAQSGTSDAAKAGQKSEEMKNRRRERSRLIVKKECEKTRQRAGFLIDLRCRRGRAVLRGAVFKKKNGFYMKNRKKHLTTNVCSHIIQIETNVRIYVREGFL